MAKAKKKATRQAQARGSEKLFKGRVLDAEQLSTLSALTRARGVKVVDWCILGQPGPDGVCGSVHVSRGAAAGVVRDLLRLNKLRLGIEVFPLGIPRPDLFEIRFRS